MSHILSLASMATVAMLHPPASMATPVTGPRWHSIFTKGSFMFGLHSVTWPVCMNVENDRYYTSSKNYLTPFTELWKFSAKIITCIILLCYKNNAHTGNWNVEYLLLIIGWGSNIVCFFFCCSQKFEIPTMYDFFEWVHILGIKFVTISPLPIVETHFF